MRAHYYRLLIDAEGNLVPNVTVRVLQPGTTSLIPELLYADDTTVTPMANPFVTTDGQVNFYIDEPRRVRLGVAAPDTPEKFYENVDVLTLTDEQVDGGIPAHEHGVTDVANSLRVGTNSTADLPGATALGDSAVAGDHGTALGQAASAPSTGSTAVGSGAETTEDNQVMVGGPATFTEFPNHVVLKGTSGTRYEVRVDDTDPESPQLTFTAITPPEVP